MKRTIYVVSSSSLSSAQFAMFISLQGIANRSGQNLLLDIDNYLRFLDEERYEIARISFEEALSRFIGLCSSYSLFYFDDESTSYNAACSLSSAKGSLATPSSLISLVKGKLPLLEDLRTVNSDYIAIQEYVFDKYRAFFKKDGLIHQVMKSASKLLGLRDFGITRGWFIFYADESERGRAFLNKVLSWADRDIQIYGWTSDEISFVDAVSRFGDSVVPMDWSNNHSFFGEEKGLRIHMWKQPVTPMSGKHYLAIEVSDGDNVQWLERDFAFSSYFGERDRNRKDFPLTFTISPSLPYLNPAAMKYIYSLAKNEGFATGVSGLSYMNPCAFPADRLRSFCAKTAQAMELADLRVVTLLDNKEKQTPEILRRVLASYAEHPNIIGGFYEIDPICYAGGNGKIFWSGRKPFVSVKYSFWMPAGFMEDNKAWIKELAAKINSQPISPDSEEGYTLLNVHPWSTTIHELNYLVSLLDEHVQILDGESFISLISQKLGGQDHDHD